MGLVLDSLDDIHCLTEAKYKDTDFLTNILEDEQLHALLNLYDQISTNSYRPFRLETLPVLASRLSLSISVQVPTQRCRA